MGENPKDRQGSNPVPETIQGITLVRLPLPGIFRSSGGYAYAMVKNPKAR